jgi:hypothetical protein
MKLHHTTKCSSAPIQNCIGEATDASAFKDELYWS